MNAPRFWQSVGVLLGIVSFCSWAEQGTIIDQVTGRPLEGVVVVASFYGKAFNPVQPHTFCYHVDVAVSDAQGDSILTAGPGTSGRGLQTVDVGSCSSSLDIARRPSGNWIRFRCSC